MFEFWLTLAILFILLEVALNFTIVLFFTSLAGFTVAGLIFYDYIPTGDIIKQFAVFSMSTTLWALILWKPLKNAISKIARPSTDVSNIIGQQAVIAEKSLKVGHIGLVKWSGTLVRAKIDATSINHVIEVDKEVVITDITDNIFIVKEFNL